MATMDRQALEDYLRKEGKLQEGKARLYLMNGYQMEGTVMEMYDGWLLFLDLKENKKKPVFYHAISTIG